MTAAKAGISPVGASSMVAALCCCTDLALSMAAKSNSCDALQLFLGDTNRTISETPMNQASSRSHCVFTIYMEARQASTTVSCLAGLQSLMLQRAVLRQQHYLACAITRVCASCQESRPMVLGHAGSPAIKQAGQEAGCLARLLSTCSCWPGSLTNAALAGNNILPGRKLPSELPRSLHLDRAGSVQRLCYGADMCPQTNPGYGQPKSASSLRPSHLCRLGRRQ